MYVTNTASSATKHIQGIKYVYWEARCFFIACFSYVSFVLGQILQANIFVVYVRPPVTSSQAFPQERGNVWAAIGTMEFKLGESPLHRKMQLLAVCCLSAVLLSQLPAVLLHSYLYLVFMGRMGGLSVFLWIFFFPFCSLLQYSWLMVSENLLIKPEYSVLQKMCSKFLIASCFLKITSAITLFEASKNEELIQLRLIPPEGAWGQMIQKSKLQNTAKMIVILN